MAARKPFLMMLSADERTDLEIRANACDVSMAEYVRRALRAVASVGGPEEFVSRKTKRKEKTK
jgi:hypothetical protein